MPASLRAFLEGVLTPEEIDELWEYLDGTGTAIEDMIATLVESHKDLLKSVRGNHWNLHRKGCRNKLKKKEAGQ
jgi:hypothetical protein